MAAFVVTGLMMLLTIQPASAAIGDELAKFIPSDGAANDEFGFAVGISGNTAIVGARWDDDNGSDSGSAYLFDITNGTQLGKLTPSDGAIGDEFAYSVGISGNTAIVGAFADDDNGDRSGSAYLFDVASGSQLAKLTPNDADAFDRFGWSVGISGNTAIIGATLDFGNGTGSGSAYLFDAAIPEPGTMLLGAIGTAGVLVLRRR